MRIAQAIKSWLFGTGAAAIEPVIIPRSEHEISRSRISDNALKVLYRLSKAGYEAYLVGGGVRDLSLGRAPKDFDVATDAHPDEVKTLFRNCRLIGRRFRLAHVHFGPEIIEVATFRALHDGNGEDVDGDVAFEDGRIVRDNVYGTLEEDAFRRDFTINALYYNIADFSVVDHTGGMEDLKHGVVRLIGDVETRYREDPVRMLRAVRFAAKLGFRIDPATAEPIPRLAELLGQVPPARLFDETLKLFMAGAGRPTFDLLRETGLFEVMFPDTEAALRDDTEGVALAFIRSALENTDRRVNEDKPVTPAFLFGAFLWPVVQRYAGEFREEGHNDGAAIQMAGSEAHGRQQEYVALPKRFGVPMKEIWSLQPRLEKRGGRRAVRLMGHPRFRAAYDFLLQRAAAGEVPQELADWWTQLQAGEEADREALIKQDTGNRRRRRRGRGRRSKSKSQETHTTE